jgi:hypothetical protein
MWLQRDMIQLNILCKSFLPILEGSSSLGRAHTCLRYIHPIANMQNVNTANCLTIDAASHAISILEGIMQSPWRNFGTIHSTVGLVATFLYFLA